MPGLVETICGTCLCIGATVTLFLVIGAFSTLDINEIGLNYSAISK